MLVEVSNSRTSIVVNAGKADISTERRIPKSAIIDIAAIRRGVDDGKVTEGNGGIFQSGKIIAAVVNRRKFKHGKDINED
jgi:hypothetical protein